VTIERARRAEAPAAPGFIYTRDQLDELCENIVVDFCMAR
jgi:hypothetical protein